MDVARIEWRQVTPDALERLVVAARRVLVDSASVKAAYLDGSAVRPGRLARDLDLGLLAGPEPPAWPGELAVAADIAGELDRVGTLGLPLDLRLLTHVPHFWNTLGRNLSYVIAVG